MKSLKELKEIRAKMKQQSSQREMADDNDIRIAVGMATCGIAAGARPVLNKFVEEVAKRNLHNVKVVQTGCIGMCVLEPIVEVFVPGEEKVTYIHVKEDMVAKIVADHIVNGNAVSEYTIGNENTMGNK